MDDIKQSAAALNESLSKTRNEVELLAKSIDIKRVEFTEEVTKQTGELDKQVKSLGKETILLHTLPKKLTTQLGEIIPNIAAELHRLNQQQIKELRQAHKNSVADQNNAIKDAASRLKQIKDEIGQIDGQRIKRYFLGFGVVILVSVLASLGATYAMIRMFPQHVHIQSPNNITVQESEVSLWSSQNVNISGDVKQQRRGR